MELTRFDMEAEVLRFRPLVVATARRYAGRGAEFDDLMQEGFMALLELIPKCVDRERLPLFLKSRLPARVRTAARREWRREWTPLEDIEGTAAEPSFFEEPDFAEEDLFANLELRDRELVMLLAEGVSQKEAGGRLGITQQAVSARLRAVRKRLAPVIDR
ncbi:MAG: sigma-70 family RNA polymerase sigma factor [Synergistaceae bacterium]|nr:sigma-70 family RNA polymerase sigma factor [Synergistaceae bacterium]